METNCPHPVLTVLIYSQKLVLCVRHSENDHNSLVIHSVYVYVTIKPIQFSISDSYTKFGHEELLSYAS